MASLARAREHGFGRRWIVAKENGDGLGFTDTKYFGQGCADVSLEEVEIGWMLTPAFSGQACATEAARAVRGEAFERLRLESIVAVHHPANASSGRIMEKLGMGSSATSSPATHDGQVRRRRRGQSGPLPGRPEYDRMEGQRLIALTPLLPRQAIKARRPSRRTRSPKWVTSQSTAKSHRSASESSRHRGRGGRRPAARASSKP